MGFKECDKELRGIFIDLRKDNDQVALVMVGEPEVRQDVYQGVRRSRACFPVLTELGLSVWVVGSRLYRTLKDDWKRLKGKTLVVTRHGKKGDTGTAYEVEPVTGFPKLLTAAKSVTKVLIEALLIKATKVVTEDD